jgi:hypothetical protein
MEFGYSAAEAVGQNLDLIIPDHLRTQHWRGHGVRKPEGRPTSTRGLQKARRKLYVDMTSRAANRRDSRFYD